MFVQGNSAKQIFIATLLALGVVLLYIFSLKIFILLTLLAVVLFFAWHLDWGLYLLAGTGLLVEWQVDFSHYHALREYPYLPQINAPLVDLLALVLLVSLIVAIIFQGARLESYKRKTIITSSVLYGLFLILALSSVFNVWERALWGLSLKNFFRPLVMVYLAYICLPVFIMSSRQMIKKIFNIWFVVGLLASAMGLVSFFILGQTGWMRAIPFGIHGFAPLGYNQNVLAQALVAIIPGVWYLYKNSQSLLQKKIYAYGGLFIGLIALTTLSRALWLALILQIIIIVGFNYKTELKAIFVNKKNIFWLILLATALSGYFISFLIFSPVVSSSTFARFETVKIVWFYFQRAPWLGYGPGMYIPLINSVYAYVLDFGESLEAHGLLYKIIIEQGILGLILLLSFFGWIIRSLWQKIKLNLTDQENKIYYSTLLSLVCGVILFQFFNTGYWQAVMWLPLGVALVGQTLESKK